MRIRITATPPGRAPEDIRRQWVGCIMTSTGRENTDRGDSSMRVGTANIGGYKVLGSSAFEALRVKCKTEALEFWRQFIGDGDQLIFAAVVCEEVP